MALPTLAEVKDHLQITTDKHDAELQTFLDAVVQRLAFEVGPLEPTTVTDEVHTGPGPIFLRQRPVQSVTTITDYGTAVADTDLDATSGILYPNASLGVFSAYSRGIKVTYEAGFDTLPADLRLALLEFVRHLWTTQRGAGAGGARANLISGDGVDPTTAAGMASYSLPPRVREMIAPYRLTAGIA